MRIERVGEIVRKEGLNGLVERLKRRIARRLERQHSATTVTHEEAMKWFELRKEGYDRLIAAVYPYISKDGVIFDIGANIGYFTFLLAKRLGFEGTAYLFEPVPHLAELCKTTFRDAAFNVTVLDVGLSDRDAEEDIFVAGNGNLGWNTIVAERAGSDMTKVRIRLKPFESCGIDVTPSLIKVDVEGAEYLVLKGMLGCLRRWRPRPVVLCEIGWGRSHPAWEEEVRVFAEMKQMGYVICDLDGVAINEEDLQATTDVLFIPREA